MSRIADVRQPLSLAHYFEPPDGLTGWFGYMCGYTADSSFVESALERFTGSIGARRAYSGRMALVLMTDPGNPQISPTEAPGLLHAPFSASSGRPFRLLHAKVAMLGFRAISDPEQWCLRLIVSTGNWTRETLENSLDLVWCLDIQHEEVALVDDSVATACADVHAAWTLLYELTSCFDLRALEARPSATIETEAASANREFLAWIEVASRRRGKTRPRFIDNRRRSLLKQLPERVRTVAGDGKRNYLALASGYFQADQGDGTTPSVLEAIFRILAESDLLTSTPEVDLIVNRHACQAVASAARAILDRGWTIREPLNPAWSLVERELHAKFVFSANYRPNSPYCNSAWIYLGSGNLTGPGFREHMSASGGNLEAGVILRSDGLVWEKPRTRSDEIAVSDVLPLQWDTTLHGALASLSAGGSMPERECTFLAAPIAYLYWIDQTLDSSAALYVSDADDPGAFDVLTPDGSPCRQASEKHFEWTTGRPRQVQVRWSEGADGLMCCWVPVIDRFGRYAATPLPDLGIEDAWHSLAEFPGTSPIDDSEAGEESAVVANADSMQCSVYETGSYEIRRMMLLIERIAAKQTGIGEVDWSIWCQRLEQTLTQSSGSPEVAFFKKLGLNPLSPLRAAPFRPSFAELDSTAHGQRYEHALNNVERTWKVQDLAGIGVEG